MLSINRLLLVGLLSVGITAATTAQAGSQLFTMEWTVKAFGNELTGGTGESAVYSAFGIPQGIQCNANQPRCPFESTPTDGAGGFAPLGGNLEYGLYCAPWYNWDGRGTTARRTKDYFYFCDSLPSCRFEVTPPLYRNPLFFTPSGQPGTTFCSVTSTNGAGGKGLVQVGHPVTGLWGGFSTGAAPGKGGFNFAAAPANPARGVRTTGLVGEFPALYPYLYSYTYATLKNDKGNFAPGYGPGSFNIKYYDGTNPVASINVKQGAAKFGGTMRMLGAYTTKVCYFRVGGCSIGRMSWRYDAVGATAAFYTTPTPGVYVITKGYQALFTTVYYNTALMQQSTINVVGSRFPWTTGSVTLRATGRGPHKTVHYAHGYDNRTTTVTSGGITNVNGTIQLVTPVLTKWLVSAAGFDYETGGIGILRIKFVPEPQTWAILVAGVSLLGAATRMRAR